MPPIFPVLFQPSNIYSHWDFMVKLKSHYHVTEREMFNKLILRHNGNKWNQPKMTLVLSRSRFSERSNTKCVGITIETRPDYCLKRHLSDMLSYGCTRLEIGVQSVYEDVARDTNRLASLLRKAARTGVVFTLIKIIPVGFLYISSFLQRPHSASCVWVFPTGKGRWL